jgi:hypothetical protein
MVTRGQQNYSGQVFRSSESGTNGQSADNNQHHRSEQTSLRAKMVEGVNKWSRYLKTYLGFLAFVW